MKKSLLRRVSFAAALALLFLMTGAMLSGKADRLLPDASILAKETLSVKSGGAKTTVILDPGHGGEDGGAVGVSGVLEKDLNLALALQTKELLAACGYDVILTRTSDGMLESPGAGGKKAQDLRARLQVAQEHPEALFISIHMNKFPMAYCRGIQLFYAGNGIESLRLGQAFYRHVALFQKDNHRELKKGDGSIYLLDRAAGPCVLVECGFLSNPEEEALLSDANYRKELSLLILASVDAYLHDGGA